MKIQVAAHLYCSHSVFGMIAYYVFLYRVCVLLSSIHVQSRILRFAFNTHTHTHTQAYTRLMSGTTWVSRYQKGKNQSGFY